MEESTFSYALRDVVNILITKFLSEKIVFPSTELEINEITNGFRRIGRIPNVIGAIDGSHIPIKAPHLFPVDYFNRKGFYSIVLQALVDHKKKFLDICVGWSGSTIIAGHVSSAVSVITTWHRPHVDKAIPFSYPG